MTDKQIKLADAIVNNFKERDGITTHAPSIMSILGETGFHKNDVTYVIKILENKNILAPTKMDFDVVFLTDK